jgi:hypothetical protein
MNRALWIILPIVGVVLFGAAIAGAYRAGTRNDDDRAIVQTLGTTTGADGQPVQVVRVVDERYGRHFGFFPFFFIGPLVFILLVVLVLSLVRRGRWGGPGYPPYAAWGGGSGGSFEEWHQRQHSTDTGTSGESPKP